MYQSCIQPLQKKKTPNQKQNERETEKESEKERGKSSKQK